MDAITTSAAISPIEIVLCVGVSGLYVFMCYILWRGERNKKEFFGALAKQDEKVNGLSFDKSLLDAAIVDLRAQLVEAIRPIEEKVDKQGVNIKEIRDMMESLVERKAEGKT